MAHVSPFISDPFGAIQTVINGNKDKVERIHAALGVVDFVAVTFLPHDHPPMAAVDMSEEDCCKALADCCGPKAEDGVAAAQFPWEVVLPLVLSLLKKWFPSWF